ncbi:ribonuclease H-like domain-containing protein [Clostridium sp. YIM B02505]|uniref:Ribonuclease H-like domain-containing protein n=1 Tax=Clostridium yunnanense TaxID=2800325 RepID=A0ABS1EWC8_9CLOT|nr:ribonuclease H-like domain-containing protein [Clostridium yunnanense]MBK1813679.1 ribonuclease H-like domain-containing protein [Clostridium yunnanense]
MELVTTQRVLKLERALHDKYDFSNIAFIDIEATGFDKINNKVFAVSVGKFKDSIFINEILFCEHNEEKQLLESFLKLIKEKKIWCTFNGLAFDEPFIFQRLSINGFKTPIIDRHIDFYREIAPYRNSLNLDGYSLKDMEKYLGIQRKDSFNGKECRDAYFEYLSTGDEAIKNKIILHNQEDVSNLPLLFLILKDIEDRGLKRDDMLSKNQKQYIKYLVRKKGISFDKSSFLNMPKKVASRIIYELIQNKVNINKIEEILGNKKSEHL